MCYDPFMPTEDLMVDGTIGNLYGGLTKREYFAAMFAQGLISANYTVTSAGIDSEKISRKAVTLSDALIKELNK